MPMWSSVANLKESLSKIALDVHDDDDEELSLYTSPPRDQSDNASSGSEPRVSRNSSAPTHSPIVNGFDSPSNHEIELYKTKIKKLQESESEIKALSVNYAALLKEKEDQILRLTEENGSLKQNLLSTNAAHGAPKTVLKGNGDMSPNRYSKAATKYRGAGSTLPNGIVTKHDGLSNGTTSTNSRELDAMEDKIRSFTVMQSTHESQMKQMMVELDKERGKLASIQLSLQEEQKLNGSFQQELSSLKDEKHKMLKEINRTQDELSQKMSEIGRLQMELQRGDRREPDNNVEKLKKIIASLERENINIKKEKEEFEAALNATRSSPVRDDKPDGLHLSSKHSSSMNEGLLEKEEMQKSMLKLENDLKEARLQKDKALQELNRLKQHLLEKESEESEKMDEDSKIIEELRGINEQQKVQISHLEKALKQAISRHEEVKMSNNSELVKAKETIDELNRKLTSCFSTIDAKNMEVLNLQTALGQYYAEIEAKERLAEELSVTKEESARLIKQLKEAHQLAEASKREKEELLGKLSHADSVFAEGKNRVKKLEEDNEKLRRALEQSMTRLNRMSVDSDFLVDRRIVIKLLVTYFQRNHSKEVLDLMCRMLGFSDEEKQRIGVAQQGPGKGVVRGVLGLPGRLVGGILGGGSASEAHSAMASDDQSFADLWVDFLLTETEREKRESANNSNPDQKSTGNTLPLPDYGRTTPPYLNQNQSLNQIPSLSHGNFLRREPSDSEFSTVPLTSSESSLQGSRLPPRY
ncbi:golgin candidate 4-like [Salvia miltiorrhiza]|uniref:golgin candidate 4-like n=1 Tax=Salvia miltiorrhiza TaxID=226208 RepID=UPI0025AD815B|nr:golgin candidate 4-like [Salvia miltiorrhiza]XP_057780384.1 golgin candidate 4-like [Salvia miltiorrhiza]